MTGDIRLRAAVEEDSYDLAYLHSLAGGGIVEFLLRDLVPGTGPIDLFATLFAEETVPYTFRNCVVAEDVGDGKGKVVGKLHTYPFDEEALAEPHPLIPAERYRVLEPLQSLPANGSFYISAVAVLPDHRGRGLGSRFLDLAKSQARERGFDEVSLHVFEDNESAIRLYGLHGFAVTGRTPIVQQPTVHHEGDMLLMRCALGAT